MKQLPVFVFTVLLFTAACSNSDKKSEGKKDKYEETKESLAETEKKNPGRFLKAVLVKDRKDLLGRKVIKGTVKNNATVASYKDVELEISFFSETGTLLGKENENIYKIVAPGKEVDFKSKYFAPDGTDSVALKVIGAKSE